MQRIQMRSLRVPVILSLMYLFYQLSNAQLGLIQSVSRYKSCQESPMYQQNSVTCANFSSDQEVIVIRAQVSPSARANVQNLVFTLRDLPGVDQTHTFQDGSDQSLACRGVPIGSECNLATNILVISFDASRLFAGYTLQKRAQEIPACYSIQTVLDLSNNCSSDVKSLCQGQKTFVNNIGNQVVAYPSSPQCTTLYDITSKASLQAAFPLSSGGEQNPCPTEVNPKAQPFYTAPATNSLYSKSGECPLIYCRICDKKKSDCKKPTWTLSSPLPVPYKCSVYDIEPTSRAIMAADIVLQTKTYNSNGDDVLSTERLQVSTIKGGMPVLSEISPAAAQLLRVNKGLGVAGPIVLGAVVTCNANGTMNTGSGIMNDAPGRLSPQERNAGKGTVLDDYYNPYTETNYIETKGQSRNMLMRCLLPTEPCRSMMLPKWYRDMYGDNSVGHYYYVSFARLNQYGEQCNQNGMDPNTVFQSKPIQYRYCRAQDLSNVQAAGECVPGYRQLGDGTNGADSDGTVVYTSTPVVANLNHALYLAGVNAQTNANKDDTSVPEMQPAPAGDKVPSVDFMPLDYLPTNPNYWMAHGMLVREGLFGASSSASLDVQIMVQATEFLGEVVAQSSGTFADVGMSCDATTSGQGRVSYVTQSTGTIGGEYFLVPTAIIPAGGDPNTNILPELESILLITGTSEAKEVQYQKRSWSPRSSPTNGRDQFFFNYVYQGPLQNLLQFQLDIYIRSPPIQARGGFVRVATTTVGCTITRGVVQDLAGKTQAGDQVKGEDLSDLYQCLYWYNNIFRCWGHYDRKWKLFVNLLATSAVILSALGAAITGVIAVCLAYLRGPKVTEISRSQIKELRVDEMNQ